MALDFDFVAIQEVGAAKVHTESLRRLAMRQDWHLSFGPTLSLTGMPWVASVLRPLLVWPRSREDPTVFLTWTMTSSRYLLLDLASALGFLFMVTSSAISMSSMVLLARMKTGR
eukprot:5289027-Amphidinium_carterae.1